MTNLIATYGIGTFLTNDFQKASNGKQHSKPLNIVIKLNKINGKDCVKLSDDVGKVSLGEKSPDGDIAASLACSSGGWKSGRRMRV